MSSMLHGQPLTVDSLCQAAMQGDLLAKDIISGVGAHVGHILAIMVNLFNPQKILIGSPLSKAADILFRPLLTVSVSRRCRLQQEYGSGKHAVYQPGHDGRGGVGKRRDV